MNTYFLSNFDSELKAALQNDGWCIVCEQECSDGRLFEFRRKIFKGDDAFFVNYFQHGGFLRCSVESSKEIIDKISHLLSATNTCLCTFDGEFDYDNRCSIHRSIVRGDDLQFEVFSGIESPLSLWYPCAIRDIDDTDYSSAGQFLMAFKARLFEDEDVFDRIMNERDAAVITKLGSEVKNFNSDVWDEYRVKALNKANILKFDQNYELRNTLSDTENKVLVEANTFDNEFSCGLEPNHQHILQPIHWRGENILGFVLMNVRDLFKVRKGVINTGTKFISDILESEKNTQISVHFCFPHLSFDVNTDTESGGRLHSPSYFEAVAIEGYKISLTLTKEALVINDNHPNHIIKHTDSQCFEDYIPLLNENDRKKLKQTLVKIEETINALPVNQELPHITKIHFQNGVNDDLTVFRKRLAENLFISDSLVMNQENRAGSEEIYKCYNENHSFFIHEDRDHVMDEVFCTIKCDEESYKFLMGNLLHALSTKIKKIRPKSCLERLIDKILGIR